MTIAINPMIGYQIEVSGNIQRYFDCYRTEPWIGVISSTQNWLLTLDLDTQSPLAGNNPWYIGASHLLIATQLIY